MGVILVGGGVGVDTAGVQHASAVNTSNYLPASKAHTSFTPSPHKQVQGLAAFLTPGHSPPPPPPPPHGPTQ